jgi:hypothetical protein
MNNVKSIIIYKTLATLRPTGPFMIVVVTKTERWPTISTATSVATTAASSTKHQQ